MDVAASSTTVVSPREMHGHAPAGSSDTWLFNIEAMATLSISAWYVFEVFITLGIVPENAFYDWGSHWVIPMLLGVFYLGSGYLYQRHQRVTGVASWAVYMRREAIVLLTPFLAFLVLTLLATGVAATQPGLVATGLASGAPVFTLSNLVHAVVVHPVGPVGYFVVLLGLFAITFTPRTRSGMGLLLACACVAKALAIGLTDVGLAARVPYYLIEMANNWVWFVLGISMAFFDVPRRLANPRFAGLAIAVFVAVAATLLLGSVTEAAALALLTALGLVALYALSAALFLTGRQVGFFAFVTRYTMAIWLMHQLLSVLAFSGLYALGFHALGAGIGPWAPLYALTCLACCYPLPVLVMAALSRIGKLGFIVYPSRYLPATFK